MARPRKPPKFPEDQYHVNYEGDSPRLCHGMGCQVPARDHFDSAEEAEACFEAHIEGNLLPKPIKRGSPEHLEIIRLIKQDLTRNL